MTSEELRETLVERLRGTAAAVSNVELMEVVPPTMIGQARTLLGEMEDGGLVMEHEEGWRWAGEPAEVDVLPGQADEQVKVDGLDEEGVQSYRAHVGVRLVFDASEDSHAKTVVDELARAIDAAVLEAGGGHVEVVTVPERLMAYEKPREVEL